MTGPGVLDTDAVRLEHGWLLPDGRYLCDGCAVRGVHEHRCHGGDGGRECGCAPCLVERVAVEARDRDPALPDFATVARVVEVLGDLGRLRTR